MVARTINELLRPIASLAVALLLFCAGFGPASALEVGDQVPTFELPGRGHSVRLLQKPGKVVYVDFWASWCGTCRQSFPWMNAIQHQYKDRDFQVIGINLDAEQSFQCALDSGNIKKRGLVGWVDQQIQIAALPVGAVKYRPEHACIFCVVRRNDQ